MAAVIGSGDRTAPTVPDVKLATLRGVIHFMRLRSAILFLMTASLAWGAAIDGVWMAEMKVRGGKKTGGQERIVQVRLNLKSDGEKATGTVISGAKKRSSTAQIVDGKVDGNRFTFTTLQTTKKGEQRLVWSGTVEGDTLQGTRSRSGGKRGQPFTAKRG
jgi:hypothetical protein